jgi:hypothetical protein
MTNDHIGDTGIGRGAAKKLSMSQAITSSLYCQGRNVIIPFLVVVLFTMLHPNLYYALLSAHLSN